MAPNKKRPRESCVKRRGPTCFHANLNSNKKWRSKKGAFLLILHAKKNFKKGEIPIQDIAYIQESYKVQEIKKIKKKGRSNQELQDSSKDYQEESKVCQEQLRSVLYLFKEEKRRRRKEFWEACYALRS